MKIGVSFFVVIHNILERKKSAGYSQVETAWNAPFISCYKELKIFISHLEI